MRQPHQPGKHRGRNPKTDVHDGQCAEIDRRVDLNILEDVLCHLPRTVKRNISSIPVEAEAAQRTGGADGSGSVAELQWVPRLTDTNAVNLWSVFGGLSFPYPRITRQAFRF
jgi:hypothetical protein